MTQIDNALALVIINLITVIPPTIMALAALKSSRRIENKVGEPSDGNQSTTLSEVAISQESALRIAATILDRMDERLETVEKSLVAVNHRTELLADDAASHAEWHRKGQPERRKTSRD